MSLEMYIVQITGKYINILVSAGGEFKKANTNIFSPARLTREFLFALLFVFFACICICISIKDRLTSKYPVSKTPLSVWAVAQRLEQVNCICICICLCIWNQWSSRECQVAVCIRSRLSTRCRRRKSEEMSVYTLLELHTTWLTVFSRQRWSSRLPVGPLAAPHQRRADRNHLLQLHHQPMSVTDLAG